MRHTIPIVLIVICATLEVLLVRPCVSDIVTSMREVRDSRHEIILLSWRNKSGHGYSFELVPAEDFDAFLRTFYPEMSRINTMPALKTAISALPNNTVIVWRDWPPFKCVFPPDEITERTKKFAADRHLDLNVIPTLD